MDKEKFEEATLRIFNLIKAKSRVVNLVTFDNEAKEISKALNEFIDNYIDREIIKAARELLKAAGDDIIGTPTPAGIKKYPSGKREFVCTKLSYRYDDAVKNTD